MLLAQDDTLRGLCEAMSARRSTWRQSVAAEIAALQSEVIECAAALGVHSLAGAVAPTGVGVHPPSKSELLVRLREAKAEMSAPCAPTCTVDACSQQTMAECIESGHSVACPSQAVNTGPVAALGCQGHDSHARCCGASDGGHGADARALEQASPPIHGNL